MRRNTNNSMPEAKYMTKVTHEWEFQAFFFPEEAISLPTEYIGIESELRYNAKR